MKGLWVILMSNNERNWPAILLITVMALSLPLIASWEAFISYFGRNPMQLALLGVLALCVGILGEKTIRLGFYAKKKKQG